MYKFTSEQWTTFYFLNYNIIHASPAGEAPRLVLLLLPAELLAPTFFLGARAATTLILKKTMEKNNEKTNYANITNISNINFKKVMLYTNNYVHVGLHVPTGNSNKYRQHWPLALVYRCIENCSLSLV